jgi:hypothetical protein
MTNKRKHDDNGNEDIPARATYDERIDMNCFEHISKLILGVDTDNIINSMIKKMSNKSANRVEYRPSGTFLEGRLYANGGISGLPKWIVNIIAGQYYHDVDMVNAGPTIALYVIEKHFGDNCYKFLKKYVNGGRERYMSRLRTKYDKELGCKSDSDMKKLIASMMTYGNLPPSFMMERVPELHNIARKFAEYAKLLRFQDPYCPFWNNDSPPEPNPEGTFMSKILHYHENMCLMHMTSFVDIYASKTNNKVEVLKYDGALITRSKISDYTELNPYLLRQCEEHILSKTGITIKLKEKPMEPTTEDWERYWGEEALTKLKNQQDRMRYLLRWNAQKSRYVRRGGDVFAPHTNVRGVVVRLCNSVEYINSTLKADTAFRSAGDMKQLEGWMDNHEDVKFPLLRPGDFDDNICIFKDGYFEMDKATFFPWDKGKDVNWRTEHYFEKDFPKDTNTPLWDDMILTQMDSVTKDVFECLIGRLFFPVNKHDNWQVLPFLKGYSDTGKSTALSIIVRMFPANTVTCIGANMELQFGLSTAIGKRLVLFPDMDKDINKSLPQGTFQSMVTGENVQVAQKYKVAKGEKWDVPGIIASNYDPNYKDTHGQLSRRLAVFPYATKVPEKKRNVLLAKEIVEGDELANIFVRCIRKYKEMRAKHGSKGFWSFAPDSLLVSKTNLREGTDHLANFIANGDDFYDIIHDPEAITTLVNLETAYSNHMQYSQKMLNQKIGTERDAIANANFTEKVTKICKLCSNPAKVKYADMCTNKDLHGKPGNRKDLICFTGMLLRKKNRPTKNTFSAAAVADTTNRSHLTSVEDAAYEKMRQSIATRKLDVEDNPETMEQTHTRLMKWRNTYMPTNEFELNYIEDDDDELGAAMEEE